MNCAANLSDVLLKLTPRQQEQLLRSARGMIRDSNPVADSKCEQWKELVNALDAFPSSYEDWVSGEDGEYQNQTPTWVFRGQTRASWPLASSFERFTTQVDEISARSQLVRDFKGKARLYSADLGASMNDVDWLALMQHHGVPTKLLDFSYSPYVAAYFALQNPEPAEGYAMIWAVELQALQRSVDRVYATLKSVPRDSSGLLTQPRRTVEVAFGAPKQDQQTLEQEGFVVPILPKLEPLRLSAQQGLFLLNGAPGLSFEESLRRLLGSSAQHAFRSIAVNRAIRAEALRKLQQMNVHELSLFPGLDGLAKFVAMKADLFCARANNAKDVGTEVESE